MHIIFFLFLHENICCGYSLEVPQRGASNEYPQHMFSLRNKKDISIFRMKKSALSVAMMVGLWESIHVFVMLLATLAKSMGICYGAPSTAHCSYNCRFFDLGFTALSRIFHLYRADRTSNVRENRRTQGKTT